MGIKNKIICEDETGKIEIVYFNSREGYLRKIYPINKETVIDNGDGSNGLGDTILYNISVKNTGKE